ncbi:hypothetical protein OROMI_008211 [Orobanche minor]
MSGKKKAGTSGRGGAGVSLGGGGGGGAAGEIFPTVFWDLDNFRLPNKFDCKNITRMMAKSLTQANIGLKCSQVMLYAFGDRQVLPKNFIKDVRSSNPLALVEHVSPDHPDACDMSLMSRMQLWARVNRPPLTVVLISGDSDFSNVTSTLRQMGYVVVAVCSKGCVSLRLQDVADCVMDWSYFVTGRGSEGIFIHRPRPPPQPFQPSPSESLDNRPISVYWDYDTCPLPEEHKGEKLYETFHDLLGPITISVYVKSESVAEELKVQFQDQHMLLRHVPDDGKPSQNIEAKYNSSKLILVDMGASLFHSPRNVILIITDANLIHLVQNVMLDRAIATDTTVIVAQSVSNGRRIKYKHAWDWDWPELLSGDRPPRVRSKK